MYNFSRIKRVSFAIQYLLSLNMKTLFSLPVLLLFAVANTVHSQTVDCTKLYISNIAYHNQDSTAVVSIYNADSTKHHINYPFVASVLNADTKDTISARSGAKYYAQLSKSLFKYQIGAKKSWSPTNAFIVNFEFADLVEHPNSPSELHTCPLVYKPRIETLDCNKLKLIRDTVAIDFSKNKTDLKYTYSNATPFDYPSFKFESKSKEVTISDSLQWTYQMFNEIDLCSFNCKAYTPMHLGMKFSTNVITQSYIPGTFTIGDMDGNTCSFGIVYKVNPLNITGVSEFENESIQLYPNPAEDILNVKFGNEKQYKVFEATGREVRSGYVKEGQINVVDLKAGIYFLRIDEKYFTVFKK